MVDYEGVVTDWLNEDERRKTEWVAALGGVGWIAEPDLVRALSIADEVAKLEARRERLDQELADARERGRAEGLAAGADDVSALLDELARERGRVVQRAARAALAVVHELIGETDVPADRVAARVDALSSRSGGRPARLARVAPSAAAAVRRMTDSSFDVVGDARLGPLDVVVEFDDGKVEWRLAEVLSGLTGDVRRAIGEDDG